MALLMALARRLYENDSLSLPEEEEEEVEVADGVAAGVLMWVL